MSLKLSDFLGGMDLEVFLQDFWGKRPMLVKGAVKDPSSFITPHKFLELVQDEMIESRVVKIENDEYQAAHGPFEPSFVKENIGKEKTTWIVHGMNLYDPNFFELEKLARFRPNWNFDDVMLSYSTKGGSVGPHIDSYNVFIIQGRGKKKWMLNTSPDTSEDQNPNLRLLKKFEMEIEWELEEGDMIYIPPHVAHYGVTESAEGMSYSIGFKSFKSGEVYSGYFAHAMNSLSREEVFEPKAEKVKESELFELDESVVEDLFEKLKKNYLSRELFRDWLGGYLTSPRFKPEENSDLEFDEFVEELDRRPLHKDEFTRILISNEKLFIGGIEFELEDGERAFFEDVAKAPAWQQLEVNYELPERLKERLYHLYQHGFFFFTE